MMVMKASVDAGPKDLVHQVAGIFENVLMNAVGKRQAVSYDVYMSGTKKAGGQRRHGAGDAAVCRGILGMSRCRAQSKP